MFSLRCLQLSYETIATKLKVFMCLKFYVIFPSFPIHLRSVYNPTVMLAILHRKVLDMLPAKYQRNRPPALQCQLSDFLFVCVLFVLILLFIVIFLVKPRQNQGRWLVDGKLVQAPQVMLLLAAPGRLFCCLVLDVVCLFVLLLLLDMKQVKTDV